MVAGKRKMSIQDGRHAIQSKDQLETVDIDEWEKKHVSIGIYGNAKMFNEDAMPSRKLNSK